MPIRKMCQQLEYIQYPKFYLSFQTSSNDRKTSFVNDLSETITQELFSAPSTSAHLCQV